MIKEMKRLVKAINEVKKSDFSALFTKPNTNPPHDRDQKERKYTIDLDWMEEVTKNTPKHHKTVTVIAKSFKDAQEKAIKHLSKEDKDLYLRYKAGVW